ncbi:MAG: HD-GYP domain-containing protein [Chloroflexi bacterium]|nr:HD-GYP domain-containing protein [Chloroflexota bacterium]
MAIKGGPVLARGKLIGVGEVINRLDRSGFDESDPELLANIASDGTTAIDTVRLCRVIQAEGTGARGDTIQALAAAVDAKDPYTRGHSERVTHYAVLAAEDLALGKQERETLRRAAVLHDVGKIGVDERILRKPVALDPGEWLEMCTHPEKGAHMVEHIEGLAETRPAIRGHHERLDGHGYPDGLRGDQIPLGARIIAVADAFDAMVTDRPYRKALGVEFALSELMRVSGTQLDPEVAAAFVRAFEAKDKSLA